MKFTVFLACDVSCYADDEEIEAASVEEAIAKCAALIHDVEMKPGWDLGTDCHRIVEMQDEDGDTVCEDVDLDGLIAAASPAGEASVTREGAPARQDINAELLAALSDLIDMAMPENELDEDDEDREVFRRAIAARDAALKGAEPTKPQVLVVVYDGVAQPYHSPNEVEVHTVGIDSDQPEDNYGTVLPKSFRGLATQAGIIDDVTFDEPDGNEVVDLRDIRGPMVQEDDDSQPSKFGVVWSNSTVEIAQTGYEFDTKEQAEAVGLKGVEWFQRKLDRVVPFITIDVYVGTQVDWTADESEIPTGFYVDHGDDGIAPVWHEHGVNQ